MENRRVSGRGSARSVSYLVIMISEIGVDIVEVKRFSQYSRKSDVHLSKLFTSDELEYCFKKKDPSNSLAGRFAAKEAIMKALKSSGINDPIAFSSIEIQSSSTGEPIVNLAFEHDGICRVSISHTDSLAIAFAIYTVK